MNVIAPPVNAKPAGKMRRGRCEGASVNTWDGDTEDLPERTSRGVVVVEEW
nr:hypothetical protein JVH1_0752 [Rhodococcus sp. JVH1]